LTAAKKGVKVALTDAPAGFIAAEPDPTQAAVPEPTPDRLGVEAETFGGLGYRQQTVGVRHRDSFLLLLKCSRNAWEISADVLELGPRRTRRLALRKVPSSYRLERVTPPS
jgi:hypothetical protein